MTQEDLEGEPSHVKANCSDGPQGPQDFFTSPSAGYWGGLLVEEYPRHRVNCILMKWYEASLFFISTIGQPWSQKNSKHTQRQNSTRDQMKESHQGSVLRNENHNQKEHQEEIVAGKSRGAHSCPTGHQVQQNPQFRNRDGESLSLCLRPSWRATCKPVTPTQAHPQVDRLLKRHLNPTQVLRETVLI